LNKIKFNANIEAASTFRLATQQAETLVLFLYVCFKFNFVQACVSGYQMITPEEQKPKI